MDWIGISCGPEEGAARFTVVERYDKQQRLQLGMRLADEIPAEARIRMNPDAPDDIELVDCLNGPYSLLIVNTKAAEALAALGVDNVELLPIQVLNHKGKPVAEPYRIVNILSVVDCIDFGRSNYKLSNIDKVSLNIVNELVLDEAKLPTDVRLFRPKRCEQLTLIRREVGEALQEQGLRGFWLFELEDFSYP